MNQPTEEDSEKAQVNEATTEETGEATTEVGDIAAKVGEVVAQDPPNEF
ncbi:hypothetical protein Acr_04g0000440 [Actinidia rufa]|uniref:Uncharacterized protein n=1 Tax=Actinidia rufa TaxID=165716 RepID=A0A7J0EGI6_9ERIC|nr:hypothetical protein Acr_04g0000440 [Actinidia rufa]